MEGGRRSAARLAAPSRSCFSGETTTSTSSSSAIPGHSTCRPPGGRPGESRSSSTRWSRSGTHGCPTVRASPPKVAAGRALARIDRAAFRSADLTVADTDQSARFFADLARLPRERFAVCLVGAEERIFHPRLEPERSVPLFVGKLIPLHGLETILAAARLVPELTITVAGGGQLDSLLEARPPNVEWVPWIEYEQLGDSYRAARCALGIFGTSPKAARVIPNKVFQAIACGTPVITADTPAARELLTDGESALLVPPGDPDALAAALRRAAEERELLTRIAAGGREAYERHASEDVLGHRWRDVLEGVG